MTEISLRLKIEETIGEREEFKKKFIDPTETRDKAYEDSMEIIRNDFRKNGLSEEAIKAKIDYIEFAIHSMSKMASMAIKAERFTHAAIWASLKIVMANVDATNILANTLLALLKVLEGENKDER